MTPPTSTPGLSRDCQHHHDDNTNETASTRLADTAQTTQQVYIPGKEADDAVRHDPGQLDHQSPVVSYHGRVVALIELGAHRKLVRTPETKNATGENEEGARGGRGG